MLKPSQLQTNGRRILQSSSPIILHRVPRILVRAINAPFTGSLSNPIEYADGSTAFVKIIRAHARYHPPRSPYVARKADQSREQKPQVVFDKYVLDELPPSPPLPPPPSEPQNQTDDPEKASTRLRRGLLVIWILSWLGLSSGFWVEYQKIEKEIKNELEGLPDYRRRAIIKEKLSKMLDDLDKEQNPPSASMIGQYVHFHTYPDEVGEEEAMEQEHPKVTHISIYLKISLFIHENFSYSPATVFPRPPMNDWRPWTLFTYQFCHLNILHAVACYMASGVFFPGLVLHFGTKATMKLFLAGGATAAGLHCTYEKLTNPAGKMTMEEIKAKLSNPGVSEEEKIKLARYFQRSMGSSGGLIALGTISCFLTPHVRAFFIIPVPLPIRVLMAAQFIFDFTGLFYDYGFNLAHNTHIAGNVAGLLLFYLFVRKMPSRMGLSYEQMRRYIQAEKIKAQAVAIKKWLK